MRRWGIVRRGLAIAVVVACFGVPMVVQAQTQDPDYSWPPDTGGPDKVGLVIQDSWVGSSAIMVPGNPWPCWSITDPRCVPLAKKVGGWYITRVAPPCGLALPWEECVESLAVIAGGSRRSLTYTGQAPGPTFANDPAHGLPTGSTMSLFGDPDSDDPDEGYAVYLGGQMIGKKGPFRLGELSLQVFPYRLVPRADSGACLWTTATQCAQRRAFPDARALAVAVRLHNSVTGWLGGRLEDPSIRVTPVPGGELNRVEVTGKPIDLPLVAVSIDKNEITQEIRDYWDDIQDRCGDVPCPMHVTLLESWDPGVIDALRVYTPFLQDTATRVIPTWSVVPLMNAFGNPCLNSTEQLLGLVTTNATVYSPRAPSFAGGSLKYTVGALHNLPGGEVFSGTYDLVMRSETARCLYGLTNAPVKADIEVTSDGGTEQVATTAVSESHGWLHLAAYGFHFSQPTISIRLTGKSAVTTLVCKKGEKTKKVTGVAPTCPRGWRPVKRP